jgi:hypothetical protein
LLLLDLLRRVTEAALWSRGLLQQSCLDLNAVPDPSGARCPETGQDARTKACDAACQLAVVFMAKTCGNAARNSGPALKTNSPKPHQGAFFSVSPGPRSCQ